MILRTTSRFEKDLKRGKDLNKLWAILEVLLADGELHSRHRPHRLSGQWSNSWECHIEPDWLLIWDRQEDALVLVRTGTHKRSLRLVTGLQRPSPTTFAYPIELSPW